MFLSLNQNFLEGDDVRLHGIVAAGDVDDAVTADGSGQPLHHAAHGGFFAWGA